MALWHLLQDSNSAWVISKRFILLVKLCQCAHPIYYPTMRNHSNVEFLGSTPNTQNWISICRYDLHCFYVSIAGIIQVYLILKSSIATHLHRKIHYQKLSCSRLKKWNIRYSSTCIFIYVNYLNYIRTINDWLLKLFT